MNIRDTNLAILQMLGLDHLKGITAVNIRLRPMALPVVTVQFFGIKGDRAVTKFRVVEIEGKAK